MFNFSGQDVRDDFLRKCALHLDFNWFPGEKLSSCLILFCSFSGILAKTRSWGYHSQMQTPDSCVCSCRLLTCMSVWVSSAFHKKVPARMEEEAKFWPHIWWPIARADACTVHTDPSYVIFSLHGVWLQKY